MSAPIVRTTPELVEGIVDVDNGVDLTPFIRMANEITTEYCTYPNCDSPCATAYTDDGVNSRMELIERWLAAHFYLMLAGQVISGRAGNAAVTFKFNTGLGLKLTTYGQQAIFLDFYGRLAKYDNLKATQKKIRVQVIGPGCLRRYPW